jgi:type VI secretion system secreted protein Hcp
MQNMFLKITGPDIKGESVSAQGKDLIELFSFSHGVSMPISQSGALGVLVKYGRCVH